MSEQKFDLAIIGGGPAGYVSAERAGSRGLSVVLFESRELGGVCLNEGCIPTKTLLYSAKLYDNAKNSEKYGVLSENIRFDYKTMMQRKNKIVRKLVGGVSSGMKRYNVNVVREKAFIEGRTRSGISITAGGVKFNANNLLICTGSEAVIPPVPGLDISANVLTNREILQLAEVPKSLTIVGGGVIGMEFASLFNSLGTEVTVVEMLEKILGETDDELSKLLMDIYIKRGIKFHLSSKVIRLEKNTLFFEKLNDTANVTSEKILISTGRKPVTVGYGLENLGVELYHGGIKVGPAMQTNIPNVFAAGDVTGFSMLAHTAYREGEVVINNLTGRKDRMRYDAIPSVVYTNPEIASVGHTEKTALEKGIEFNVSVLPMAYAGRFVAENEGGTGICKILAGKKYGEIIGAHLLGNPASELIYGIAMAIENELTLKEMEEIVFPHPTVSEIFRETIFNF